MVLDFYHDQPDYEDPVMEMEKLAEELHERAKELRKRIAEYREERERLGHG